MHDCTSVHTFIVQLKMLVYKLITFNKIKVLLSNEKRLKS